MEQISKWVFSWGPFFCQYVQPSWPDHQCREPQRTPPAPAWSSRSIDQPDQNTPKSCFHKNWQGLCTKLIVDIFQSKTWINGNKRQVLAGQFENWTKTRKRLTCLKVKGLKFKIWQNRRENLLVGEKWQPPNGDKSCLLDLWPHITKPFLGLGPA